jgi:hypothetical protein
VTSKRLVHAVARACSSPPYDFGLGGGFLIKLMAKRTTASKTRTTLLGCLVTFVCAVAIPWGPGCLGCEFDTSPIIHKHPPVKREAEPMRHAKAGDNDSGDDHQ